MTILVLGVPVYAQSEKRIDTKEKQENVNSRELKKQLAEAKPYRTWLSTNRIELDELKSGTKGIPEPSSGAPEIPPDGISLVIVPALSCDRNGYRLGYGGGYYDRFLARTRAVAAALCAESRLTDELPREPFDLPCNYIITERQVLHTNEK